MGRRPFVREQILEAAFDCFARRGVEAVTSREVAKAAGVGPASMYRHFPSMESLARAVYAIAIEPLAVEFMQLAEAKPQPAAAVAQVVGILYRNYDQRPRALALLVFPPHDFTPWEVDSNNPRHPRCLLEQMLGVDADLAAICWGAIVGPLHDRYLGRRSGAMAPLIETHAPLVSRLLEGRS